jgi:hypothetical protein
MVRPDHRKGLTLTESECFAAPTRAEVKEPAAVLSIIASLRLSFAGRAALFAENLAL